MRQYLIKRLCHIYANYPSPFFYRNGIMYDDKQAEEVIVAFLEGCPDVEVVEIFEEVVRRNTEFQEAMNNSE